jgi:hypothetical protein
MTARCDTYSGTGDVEKNLVQERDSERRSAPSLPDLADIPRAQVLPSPSHQAEH